MTDRDMRGHFGRVGVCVGLLAAAVGCVGTLSATNYDFTTFNTGTLTIDISGTPSGHGMVVVGPAATGTEVTTSGDLSLAAGPQTVTAYLAAEPGTLVRTAYTPIIDEPNPCVRAGEVTTVHVTYAIIDTSGVVWTWLVSPPRRGPPRPPPPGGPPPPPHGGGGFTSTPSETSGSRAERRAIPGSRATPRRCSRPTA